MSAFLSPLCIAFPQSYLNTGIINSGGKLYTYLAGSSQLQATYTDSTQAVTNANPLILDSAGRLQTEIWQPKGILIKGVLQDSNANQLGSPWDNIPGINDATFSQSEWNTTGLLPTYVDATHFTVPGNQTNLFAVNQRVQYVLGSGTFYGTVITSSYDGVSTTTVAIAPDTTGLDNTISTINIGFLSAVHPSIPGQYAQVMTAVNFISVGAANPGTGAFTNLSASNVNITGGTISGIAGFSVPDFLQMAVGII